MGRTPDDFYVSGVEQWLDLSKALKTFEPELRKELHSEFRKASKPLVQVAKDTISEKYPQRGGYAKDIFRGWGRGRTTVTPVVRTGQPAGVGVRVQGVDAYLAEMYGFIRHPVRAGKNHATDPHESTWVRQETPQLVGVITDAVFAYRHKLRPALEAVVERVAQKVIDRGTRG